MAAEPRTDDPAKRVERTYLALTLISTLAVVVHLGHQHPLPAGRRADQRRGVRRQRLLHAGHGAVRDPTGVVADTRGRQLSFVLGTATLLVSTLLYLVMWQIHAPLWGWAIASILLGLGFTFFSGATEAWLVDALAATGFPATWSTCSARAGRPPGRRCWSDGGRRRDCADDQPGRAVHPAGRAAGVTMVVALVCMRDIGFTPAARQSARCRRCGTVVRGSIGTGFRNPPVRWLMLAIPFTAGTGIYVFYAAAAVPAASCTATRPPTASPAWRPRSSPAAQIVGGLMAPWCGRLFAPDRCADLGGGVLSIVCWRGWA